MHRARSRVALLALAGLLTTGLLIVGPASADNTAAVGVWSLPIAELAKFASNPPATRAESKEVPPAVSLVVLPNGKILYWGGLEGLEDSQWPAGTDFGRVATHSRSRVMDPVTHAWLANPSPNDGGDEDMFCADQRILPDGRVIVAGGTRWRGETEATLAPVVGQDVARMLPSGVELYGNDATRIYDPATNTFALKHKMGFGRWYPTLVTLPDGKVFVASGVGRLVANDKAENVVQTEIYDAATDTWTDQGTSGQMSLPLFSRMHLLPDGRIFYSGAGQMWGPFGQSTSELTWATTKAFNAVTRSWAELGIGQFGAVSGALSVLLPLKAPFTAPAKILVAGGVLGSSPGAFLATNLSQIMTVGATSVTSSRTGDLSNMRWFSSGVLLPDGTVLALSGGDKDEVVLGGGEKAVRQAELFDPAGNGGTGTWTPLSSARRDRTYHNSAVLLADGSVMVGGHSPIGFYGPWTDNTYHNASVTPLTQDGAIASNLKDPSFEIFRPPYLSRGARPTITFAQKGIAWTETTPAAFPVNVGDNSQIRKVVLVHLPATTHATDADMRSVELAFTKVGSNALQVTAPPNGKIAPPGFYYLFALADNGLGLTPSNARIVHVGPTPDVSGVALAPFGP